MIIFVISRASDTLRRKCVFDNLKDSPYEWQFFDAYEVDTIPGWFNAIYDAEKTKRYRSYALVSGEKGCFSSHLGVWLKCIALNEPVIILEDDFKPLPDFYSKIKMLELLDFEYVKLEKRSDGFSINDYFMINKKNRSGAVGYYLSPEGAFKFVTSLSSIYMPVDHYIGMSWKHNVLPVGFSSQIITHEYDFKTNIQGDRKDVEEMYSKNKWRRFLRKCRRYIDDFRYRRYVKSIMKSMNYGKTEGF